MSKKKDEIEKGIEIREVETFGKDRRAERTIHELVSRKSRIDEEIKEVQKQIYELESKMMEDTKHEHGRKDPINDFQGLSWFSMGVCSEDRLFSNSSVY